MGRNGRSLACFLITYEALSTLVLTATWVVYCFKRRLTCKEAGMVFRLIPRLRWVRSCRTSVWCAVLGVALVVVVSGLYAYLSASAQQKIEPPQRQKSCYCPPDVPCDQRVCPREHLGQSCFSCAAIRNKCVPKMLPALADKCGCTPM